MQKDRGWELHRANPMRSDITIVWKTPARGARSARRTYVIGRDGSICFQKLSLNLGVPAAFVT